ncbi:MAG: hypothetical protein QM737_08475 [Ferruginibacter sp.]
MIHHFLSRLIILSSFILVIASCKKSNDTTTTTTPEVTAPPASLGLDPFYKKYVDASGIPIVSSADVADKALLNARDIVKDMVKNMPAVVTKMLENHLRIGVIGINERPTQMPEYRDLYTVFPGTDWDNRARAYGATLERPLTTDCEENLLCKSGDRYNGEEILTHEFSHAIHELGLRFTNLSFDSDLQAAFDHAVSAGLWANTYAISGVREYWAEGVQDWYNCNKEAIPTDGVHNQINTRAELQTYDTMLYDLIRTYFAESNVTHGCY